MTQAHEMAEFVHQNGDQLRRRIPLVGIFVDLDAAVDEREVTEVFVIEIAIGTRQAGSAASRAPEYPDQAVLPAGPALSSIAALLSAPVILIFMPLTSSQSAIASSIRAITSLLLLNRAGAPSGS